MSGNWFPVSVNLRTHRKTLALVREVRLGVVTVQGLLVAFWQRSCLSFPAGDVTPLADDEKALAEILDLSKAKANRFFSSMISTGFLDKIDGKILIHNWNERSFGKWQKAMENDRLRKREERARSRALSGGQSADSPTGEREREKERDLKEKEKRDKKNLQQRELRRRRAEWRRRNWECYKAANP